MRQQVDSKEMREVVSGHIAMAHLAMHLEQLNQAVASYREQFGEVPQSPSELVEKGFLSQLPQEPFGGVYVIDRGTGAVSSSTGKKPSRLHRSKLRDKQLQEELDLDLPD